MDAGQEASLAKLRMEKEKDEKYSEFTKEERKEDEALEALNRMIYNPKEREFDNRKRRVTDMKECSRITLPRPLSTEEESRIDVRKRIQRQVYEEYRAENTDKKGEQNTNLTQKEKKGLESLLKRMAKDEIIILKTDK